MNMVFIYGLNSLLKGWWSQVRLIIWGPSARLAVEDSDIQNEIAKMLEAGVEVHACQACAERYGLVQDLEKLGVEVYYIGQETTDMLKSGWTVLTI